MRILFVTPYVPSLIRVRSLNFLRQLSLRGHEVTLVSIETGEKSEQEALESLSEYCRGIYTLRLSKACSLASCCKRLFSSVPLQAAYTEFASARDLVTQIAREGYYEVIHVEHIRGAHLTDGVKGIPKVFDSVDCITRLLKQRLQHERGVFQRALGYEELLKMRSYEARIASKFDGVVITSEQDKRVLEYLIRRFAGTENETSSAGSDTLLRQRRLMRRLAEREQDRRLGFLESEETELVSVVRNGVDSEYFEPQRTQVDPLSIVFSGKMSYFANSHAVHAFYEQVFANVRRVLPDVKFKIVGSDPPDSVRKLAEDPAVEVTGYVPDIRPHLAEAGIVVCPLSVGVGIQNKVLEAMSMGKPVVASPIACRGIPGAIDGRELLVCKDSNEMVSTITSLLSNPGFRTELGKNARDLVVDTYSWDASVRALERVYARVTDADHCEVSYAA